MLVDMETRLGMRIATFVPVEGALAFRYPGAPGGVEPSVQAFVGGVTDRKTRAASTEHPKRGVIMIEAPSADMAVLPQNLWSSCVAPPAHEWVLEQIRPGDGPSPHEAGGVCISAMDVDPAIDAEFNEWYNEEHMPLMDAGPVCYPRAASAPPVACRAMFQCTIWKHPKCTSNAVGTKQTRPPGFAAFTVSACAPCT